MRSLLVTALATLALTVVCGTHAVAQSPDPPSPPAGADGAPTERAAVDPGPPVVWPGFLTRYAFRLSAAALSSGDPRFSADTHFGGDVDVLDYGQGRVNVAGEYEAVHGNQARLFEPLQGDYTLEGSGSYRLPGFEVGSYRLPRFEIAGVLHHVSRHLSDHDQPNPIDWNVLGVRLMSKIPIPGAMLIAQADLGKVVKRRFVDYTWAGDLDVAYRRPIRPAVGLFSRTTLEMFTVDPAIARRGTQVGEALEGGLRLQGKGGAMEVFVGAEHRIDAYPSDRNGHGWLQAGFRFVSR